MTTHQISPLEQAYQQPCTECAAQAGQPCSTMPLRTIRIGMMTFHAARMGTEDTSTRCDICKSTNPGPSFKYCAGGLHGLFPSCAIHNENLHHVRKGHARICDMHSAGRRYQDWPEQTVRLQKGKEVVDE